MKNEESSHIGNGHPSALEIGATQVISDDFRHPDSQADCESDGDSWRRVQALVRQQTLDGLAASQ